MIKIIILKNNVLLIIIFINFIYNIISNSYSINIIYNIIYKVNEYNN